jgi:hypothetical protein
LSVDGAAVKNYAVDLPARGMENGGQEGSHSRKVSDRSTMQTPKRKKSVKVLKYLIWIAILGVFSLIGTYCLDEIRTSRRQARYFSELARDLTYSLGEGESPLTVTSPSGPYDRRLGYDLVPEFVRKLNEQNFVVARQARPSEEMADLRRWGIFPPYREKSQAGLKILDRNGKTIYSQDYPAEYSSPFPISPPWSSR